MNTIPENFKEIIQEDLSYPPKVYYRSLCENAMRMSGKSLTDKEIQLVKDILVTEDLPPDIVDLPVKEYLQNNTVTNTGNNRIILHKCPSCGSNIPVVNKTCEYCSHQFVDADQSISSENLIRRAEEKAREIERYKFPGFWGNLLQHHYLFFPFLAVYYLTMTLISGTDLYDEILIVFVILSIAGAISIIIKLFTVFGKKRKKRYEQYIADYEKYDSMARMYYGVVSGVDEVLDKLYNIIKQFEIKVKVKKRQSIIGLLIIILLAGIGGVLVYAISNPYGFYSKFNEYYGMEEHWQNAINESKKNDLFYNNPVEIETIKMQGDLDKYLKVVPVKIMGVYNLFTLYDEENCYLHINNVPLIITKKIPDYNTKKDTVIINLTAILTDKSGNQIGDTLYGYNKDFARFMKNEQLGTVYLDFVKDIYESKEFSQQMIQKISSNAREMKIITKLNRQKRKSINK